MASKISALGFSPFALGVTTQRVREQRMRSFMGIGQLLDPGMVEITSFDANSATAAAIRRASSTGLVTREMILGQDTGSSGSGLTLDENGNIVEEKKWYETKSAKVAAVGVGVGLVALLLLG